MPDSMDCVPPTVYGSIVAHQSVPGEVLDPAGLAGCSLQSRSFSPGLVDSRASTGAGITLTLDELLADLDRLVALLPFDEMVPLLKSLRLSEAEIDKHFLPEPERYSRNILLATTYLQLIAITWLPGQSSPIHNHAESACGVRIVTGEAVETRFDAVGDCEAVSTGSASHHAGVVFGGGGPDDIHVVANLSPTSTLRTLHLYSPPLHKEAMKIFRERPAVVTRLAT